MAKSLAEIVLGERLATENELARIAEESDNRGLPLVVCLVRELRIDEVQLVGAIRRHRRCQVADPANSFPDIEAVRTLPREVARRLRVLPLSLAGFSENPAIRLAMADPTDRVAIAEVEHRTGRKVDPCLMPLSAVEELTETSYRLVVTEVMARPNEPAHNKTGRMPSVVEIEREITASYTRQEILARAEADLGQRFEALLSVLEEKQVLTRSEFDQALERVLGRKRPPS